MKKNLPQKALAIFSAIALLAVAGFQLVSAEMLSSAAVDEALSVPLNSVPANIRALVEAEDNEKQTAADIILPSDTPFDINTQHPDGTFTAQVFGAPVSYEDENGNLQFIDTSMKKAGLFATHDYENAANEFSVYYSKNASQGVRAGDCFTISVPDAPSGSTSAKARVDTDENMDGRITYPNAFGDYTSLEYINTSLGFKDNIVLERNIGINRFDFKFQSDTHIPVLSVDRLSIQIVQKDNPEQVAYYVGSLYAYDSFTKSEEFRQQQPTPAEPPIIRTEIEETTVPYEEQDIPVHSFAAFDEEVRSDIQHVEPVTTPVIDQDSVDLSTVTPDDEVLTDPENVESVTTPLVSNEPENSPITTYKHYTEDCYYELTQHEDGSYTITAIVSEEFLNHPETIYPVTIDPAYTHSMTTSNIADTYVSEAASGTNYGTDTRMRIGCTGGQAGKRLFSFVKFNNLPSYINSSNITSAYVRTTFISGTTTSYTGAMATIGTAWTETGLKWSNKTNGLSPSATSGHNNASYYEFTATALVKNWYSGSNFGFNIAYTSEYHNDTNSMYTIQGSTSQAPKLTINYTSPTTTFIWPLVNSSGNPSNFTITSPYGFRIYSGKEKHHKGIDISAANGTQVVAVAAGTVTAATYDSEMGYYVKITHSNGYVTRSQHLKQGSTVVNTTTAKTVAQKQSIAQTGDSGSPGSYHLHINFWKDTNDSNLMNPLSGYDSSDIRNYRNQTNPNPIYVQSGSSYVYNSSFNATNRNTYYNGWSSTTGRYNNIYSKYHSNPIANPY